MVVSYQWKPAGRDAGVTASRPRRCRTTGPQHGKRKGDGRRKFLGALDVDPPKEPIIDATGLYTVRGSVNRFLPFGPHCGWLARPLEGRQVRNLSRALIQPDDTVEGRPRASVGRNELPIRRERGGVSTYGGDRLRLRRARAAADRRTKSARGLRHHHRANRYPGRSDPLHLG